MCGFVGFLDRAGFADGEALLRRMADTIVHRGPDSDGYWVDGDAGIALAHRRLAIIDLSPAGHQPMASHDGRFVLSYNGEIYNHLDLRRELEEKGPVDWRGHSDTETLLQGFSAWGVLGTLRRANGMFALALWDRADRKLLLARDRMGEKPLYYGMQGKTLLFGSELKALRQHPAWQGGIKWTLVPGYVIAQVVGAVVGVLTAHVMFGEPVWMLSLRDRSGPAQMFSELVATFGLLSVIWGCSSRREASVPYAVGAYIVAAYWFTASTAFANPAVTLARAFTNTFAGIRLADVPGFVGAQLAGALAATLLFNWLLSMGSASSAVSTTTRPQPFEGS